MILNQINNRTANNPLAATSCIVTSVSGLVPQLIVYKVVG